MNNKIETKSLSSIFFTFAGYVLSVTAFIIGSGVGLSTTLSKGIFALLIGNLILATYSGIIGYVGMKTRRSSTEILRPVFGLKGQVIISFMVAMFTLCFVSVYSSLIGSLIGNFIPALTDYFGLIVFIVIIGIINMYGFKGLSGISKFAVPLVAVFIIVGLYQVAVKIGFSTLTTAVPTQPKGFIAIVSLVAASWMTGSTFSSDLTRFAKKPSYVFIVTYGAFICVTILEIVGLVCALGTGEGDLVKILSNLNMSAISIIIYVFLGITSGQTVVYTFTLALSNISKVVAKDNTKMFSEKFWVIPGCIFAAIVGILMTTFGLIDTFWKFIGLIAVTIPPIGGLIMSHFMLVERNYIQPFVNMPSTRWSAFVALIVGIVASQFLKFGIQPLNGFFVSLVVYYILRKILPKF